LVKAGQATPASTVGPALGARGVKAMDFCKIFNAQTSHFNPGIPIACVININPDRTFTFITKTPPVPWFIKETLGLDKGSGLAKGNYPTSKGTQIIGQLSLKHVYEIARIKSQDDVNKNRDLKAIALSVIGTCRSLGVEVIP